MSSIDLVTALIAGISLVISLWTAFRTKEIAKDEIGLSKLTELHSIEQVVIDKLELTLIFKSEKDHKKNQTASNSNSGRKNIILLSKINDTTLEQI